MRREWFAEGTDGADRLSGFAGGDVGHALASGRCAPPRPMPRAAWAALFPDRYYLEVQRAGHNDDRALTVGHRASWPPNSTCRS